MVFVDQNPEKTQSAQTPGEEGAGKTKQGLRPVEAFPVVSQYFQVPGSKPQSLSAMRPEPAVKQKADSKQVNGISDLPGGKRHP